MVRQTDKQIDIKTETDTQTCKATQVGKDRPTDQYRQSEMQKAKAKQVGKYAERKS